MSDPKPTIAFKPVDEAIYVHPLSQPVPYLNNTIDSIAIRKPNGRDLLMVGSPVIADPTSGKEATIDWEKAYRMASTLSGLPEKILYQVDPADMVDLAWKIGSFFIPGWQGLLPAMLTSRDLSSAAPAPPAA